MVFRYVYLSQLYIQYILFAFPEAVAHFLFREVSLACCFSRDQRHLCATMPGSISVWAYALAEGILSYRILRLPFLLLLAAPSLVIKSAVQALGGLLWKPDWRTTGAGQSRRGSTLSDRQKDGGVEDGRFGTAELQNRLKAESKAHIQPNNRRRDSAASSRCSTSFAVHKNTGKSSHEPDGAPGRPPLAQRQPFTSPKIQMRGRTPSIASTRSTVSEMSHCSRYTYSTVTTMTGMQGKARPHLAKISPIAILRTPATCFEPIRDFFPYMERYFTLANGLRIHYIDEYSSSSDALPRSHNDAATDTSSVASDSLYRVSTNLETVVLLHDALTVSWNI